MKTRQQKRVEALDRHIYSARVTRRFGGAVDHGKMQPVLTLLGHLAEVTLNNDGTVTRRYGGEMGAGRSDSVAIMQLAEALTKHA